jgi:hypothetical protein
VLAKKLARTLLLLFEQVNESLAQKLMTFKETNLKRNQGSR